tara:strand:- start:488 stop:790 length:303 start_codon:yes stop_codon:yes gene_type:complete
MPNWKKLIVSGSDATLSSLTVTNQVTASSYTGSFTGSFAGDGSGLTGIDASTVGYSNLITLTSDYTTIASSYNSLYGPLSVEGGVTITVTAGSFLKVESF